MLPAVKSFWQIFATDFSTLNNLRFEMVNKVDKTDVLMRSSIKGNAVKLKSDSGKILIEMKKLYFLCKSFLPKNRKHECLVGTILIKIV